MKTTLLLAMLLFTVGHARGQATARELANEPASPTRTAILSALRPVIARELGREVKFVVSSLKVAGGFAFLHGNVRDANGQAIDFRNVPAYRELVEDGVFDGDGTMALLRMTGGQWKHLVHVIGPTDVAYACWWKEYGAPKSIFDYTEPACTP